MINYNYWQYDVRCFHEKFGVHIGDKPADLRASVASLRINVIKEEMEELLTAITLGDIPEVADGIADAIYVLLGTAISFGIDMDPIWREVHNTNMLKEGGPVREDGKILKPEGWKPPEIKRLLEEQGWVSE